MDKKLIPDIAVWLNCKHRRTDYYLTQVLSGHGSFRVYTYRIQKTNDDLCIYCGEKDTPEHTIFECSRWGYHRWQMTVELGMNINSGNMIAQMISEVSRWNLIHSFIKKVMSEKELEERTAQHLQ